MTPTQQTNATLAELADILANSEEIVICGHVSPDGDCIGSQLGLMHALRAIGKKATCLLVKDEPIDERLMFLPGADELVAAARYEGSPDTFVAVDVPLRDRMGSAAASIMRSCEVAMTIDHHASETRMTPWAYIDPGTASTTMLVWELAALLDAPLGPETATCCYTGLVTDTGRFQYQNTDEAALSAAASMVAAGADPARVSREIFQSRAMPSVLLEGVAVERMRVNRDAGYALSWLYLSDFERIGASRADAEPIIDTLRSLRGVRVACMLRDQGDSVRGSFRAKDHTDVAALARSLGGGGHRAAAGFTISGPVDAAVERITALLDGLDAPGQCEGEAVE